MKVIKQKNHKDFKTIQCKKVDPIKDFKMDNSCYLLIKIEDKKIHIGICNYDHEILLEFIGDKSQDIYYSIINYEKENNIEFFTKKEHLCYLGKELKKAEYAIENNAEYVQE
ncbi:hypothetical protein HOK68_01855 [Candidatus Woesearchaeota archaeon]|jgi:hypothetical protein|nr:hypothetical protein [Candidatus Woesearchaeota archaeon]MBT4387134.1 hypothetical protein [Candidatus Woesearchaeota archaeon]MBT4596109.1 hypothetical protein [Candidatus Woesearchaeota archaeon]MBT5741669.1 hypothetical protein [Candidatus Woesearchaeota archaeon]MBT6505505.1 hypothetical protein [Candidatus Woesearchaeota archaeon]